MVLEHQPGGMDVMTRAQVKRVQHGTLLVQALMAQSEIPLLQVLTVQSGTPLQSMREAQVMETPHAYSAMWVQVQLRVS